MLAKKDQHMDKICNISGYFKNSFWAAVAIETIALQVTCPHFLHVIDVSVNTTRVGLVVSNFSYFQTFSFSYSSFNSWMIERYFYAVFPIQKKKKKK